ncbi:hypothetical protein ACFCYI_21990 [Streptomyces sp. NPDC056257]|uniref:DUF7919 family protein n=1 Tax=Streptomyces sp. NPDC056257 TaxID=3345765 RepID=UPI0035D9703E
MFYEDLSPYDYYHDESFGEVSSGVRFVSYEPAYERVNIGWLADGHPWPSGPVPADFTDKLLAVLVAQPVNEMLGLHECDLCPPLPNGGEHAARTPRPGHRCAGVGTGEVRIPGPAGSAFAAPQLVGHYVADHGYQPPRVFIDAVLAFDPDASGTGTFPWIRFPWVPADAHLYDARVE